MGGMALSLLPSCISLALLPSSMALSLIPSLVVMTSCRCAALAGNACQCLNIVNNTKR